MSQTSKVYLHGKPIHFDASDYKGAGGEGTIYAKGGKAYKIYHDPQKCIEVGKIGELATLKEGNILGPREPITDSKGKPIGFWMPFVDKTEYLCKLMTRGFCDAEGISPEDSAGLVARMQTTLEKIHAHSILVVDYNEMNFLTNKEFTEVYHIDVDCYQTPHYPATAIMASIRDPKVQNNAWCKESDWFSFAILACQLYIKTHPYKGRHPDFGKDWLAMLANGVSIFNKATRMPPATLDLAVIPKGHRKWLEKVLEHGERSKPPAPDADITPAALPKPQILASTQSVTINEILKAETEILDACLINGRVWTLTKNAVLQDGKPAKSFPVLTGYQAKRVRGFLCQTEGDPDNPTIARFNPIKDEVELENIKGSLQETLPATGMFCAHKRIYISAAAGLVEISPMNLGAKTITPKETLAQIFHQHTIVDGAILEDILGKTSVTIPWAAGRCGSWKIPALDGHRILSGKYERGILIVSSEKEGVFHRTTLFFDKNMAGFEVLSETEISPETPNFCVLDKGICVVAKAENLELFAEPSKKKVVGDSPIEAGERLRTWQNQVFALHNKQILKLSLT